MADNPLPTPKELRQLLDYDPETGAMTWFERPLDGFASEMAGRCWNGRFAGKQAFTATDRHRYLQGTVKYKVLRAHRVAWAIYYGEWPNGDIDHIDQDRANNRIANLRAVSVTENNRNQALQKNNKSGRTGVSWCSMVGKWCAKIGHNGKSKALGYYATKREAIAARERAERELGYHPNHGRAVL